jgi:hypothetical protein
MLTKRTILTLQLLIAWLILMSCTCSQNHVYYSPPPQNVPLLTDSGEVNLNGGICTKDGQNFVLFGAQDQSGSSGGYIQAAYSPKKHWAGALNFMQVSKSATCTYTSGSTYEHKKGTGKGYIFDAGIGYYTTGDLLFRNANNTKLLSHLVFETYAGIGQSTQRHTYEDSIYSGSSKLDAFVLYVQPTFGIKTRFFMIGASFRLNSFYFYNIETHYPSNYGGSEYANEEIRNINFLAENPFQPFIEPAITVRAGYKWVMLQFQYVYSEPFKAMKLNAYESTKLVFGINVNLNPKWKK